MLVAKGGKGFLRPAWGLGRRGRGNWAMTPGLAIGRIGSAWDSNSNCFGVGFGACVYLIPFPPRVFFFSDLMNDGEKEREGLWHLRRRRR